MAADDFLKRIRKLDERTKEGRGKRPDTQWILVKKTRRGNLGIMDFEGNWVDYADADYEPVAFRLNQHGSVEIRGIITGGAIGETVFILPPGFRPLRIERFVCSNGTDSSAVVDVYPSGEVVVVGMAPTLF